MSGSTPLERDLLYARESTIRATHLEHQAVERHSSSGASSGEQKRHRSRTGNRKFNRVLHIMAVVELGGYGGGRAYVVQRKAEARPTRRWYAR